MFDPSVDQLTAQLEAALVRELCRRYEANNLLHFGGRLASPLIVLSSATSHLGRWDRATRTLELSRALVLGRSWLEVVTILEHEMAHQFVEEVLGIHDETAHGETFRRVCAERGIDARAAGRPGASTNTASNEPDRILDRIRKLLALAGSSNQNEAELAMRTAHELMLRHNIEASTVAAPGDRGYEVRHLGDPKKRRDRVDAAVAGLLGEFFFVKVIRVPVYVPRSASYGFVYEIVGTHANVAMASHVYAFLLATAKRLWHENRHDVRVRTGHDRLAYEFGVIAGFREKLLSERVDLTQTGLVWVGDHGLDGFYRARHPRIRRRRQKVRMNSAQAAGREAGRTVVLHKPVEEGPSGAGARLLRG